MKRLNKLGIIFLIFYLTINTVLMQIQLNDLYSDILSGSLKFILQLSVWILLIGFVVQLIILEDKD